jgi:hypothetical protein
MRVVRRAVWAGLVAALGALGAAGCARTSVDTVRVETARLPRPDLVVVHDFAVSPATVTLDRAVGAQIERALMSTPESQQRLQRAQEIARLLTQSLVEEIGQLGIPTVAAEAAPGAPATGSTLSIEGQILTVDEGNRLRRTMIGLGAGASEVRNLVQVYETRAGQRQLVEDFYATALSSRKPGFGPMAGAGAAAGRAAETATVGAGVGLASEREQTVEADAKAAAKEIAKQLRKLFVDQGWIPAG